MAINQISLLEHAAFTGLVSLEKVDLSLNYIQKLQKDIFSTLIKLKILKLLDAGIKRNTGWSFQRSA